MMIEQGKCPCVLLFHASSGMNVGDDAQMYATVRRLEKHVPGVQVIIARMFQGKPPDLLPGHEFVPAPHLYINKRSLFLRAILKALRTCGWRSCAELLDTFLSLTRAFMLLSAVRFYRSTGRLPLLGKDVRNAVRTISQCDVVYCSGGGNLNDVFLSRGLVSRAAVFRLAEILRRPVVVSGQGVGPLKSHVGRYLLRRWGRSVEFFGCRDMRESRDLLLDIGFDEQRVMSLGDDATDLCTSSRDRVSEILAEEGLTTNGEPPVYVHIRLHNFSQGFREKGIPAMARFLDRVIERFGCRIVFLPISYARQRAYDDDIGDAFEVYTSMRNRSSVSFINKHRYSPPDMKGIIASGKFLIGFSYHSWVFALSSGIPAFAVFSGEYFRAKAAGLFAWYGRESWVWEMSELGGGAPLEEISSVLAHYDADRRDLLEKTARIAAQVNKPIDFINTKLVGSGEARHDQSDPTRNSPSIIGE